MTLVIKAIGKNDILFIQTGGTIDKDYPKTVRGHSLEFGKIAAVEKILQSLRPGVGFKYLVTSVCKKDSKDITDSQRETLVSVIRIARSDRIVVTHGTDTMIETARFVDNRIRNKYVVFTGAFLPETFKNSDAMFNVGVAIGALKTLKQPGVYVTMGGAVVPALLAKRAANGLFTSSIGEQGLWN